MEDIAAFAKSTELPLSKHDWSRSGDFILAFQTLSAMQMALDPNLTPRNLVLIATSLQGRMNAEISFGFVTAKCLQGALQDLDLAVQVLNSKQCICPLIRNLNVKVSWAPPKMTGTWSYDS